MHVILCSGGAFKGAVQLATLRKLLASGTPDVIEGTSIGATNGVMAATGKMDVCESIWRELDDPHPLDGIKGILQATPFGHSGFWNLTPMAKQLEDYDIDTDELLCRFGCGIWLPENDEHILPTWTKAGPDGHSIPLHDGVLASAAIAGLFAAQPICWRGKWSLAADGGHEHVLPPPPSNVKAGDTIDAICCHPIEPGVLTRASKTVDGRVERLIAAADKGMHAPLRGDVATLQALSRLGIKVRIYAPRRDPGGMLDASKETIAYRLDDLGVEMAQKPVWELT